MSSELYDPLFHTPQANLYDVYARLRAEHPVYHNRERDVWCLTRHADVQAAARAPDLFSSVPGVDLDAPNYMGPGNFLDSDPPRHDLLRTVVRPFFVPKAVAQLEQDVTRRVDQLVEELRERESADLAHDFAWRLPIWVISRLLGAPEEDDQTIQGMLFDVFLRHPGQSDVPARAEAGLAALHSYLVELAAAKRTRPDEKVLSRMVAGQAVGVPAEEEVAGMAMLFFIAGSETTFALIANTLELLARHPDAYHELREPGDGKALERTIEEVLRFESPVQYLARTVTRPTTLHGQDVPGGARLILVWGAANRDPDRWPDPDRFLPEREPRRHVAFGEGIHFCIGAPLARLEARIALQAFASAFDEYEIAARRRLNSHIVRGWERLEAQLAW